MKTLRLYDCDEEVKELKNLLLEWKYDVDQTSIFDLQTKNAVEQFQKKQNLNIDGIVGQRTWSLLKDESIRKTNGLKLTEENFISAAQLLEVEVAAIKAVKDVETGGRGGFFDFNHPAILFEGHIFWNQLKKHGLVPEDYLEGNSDILYPKWTRSYYKGGMGEYGRLERAKQIHLESALLSASWGLFQIMGFNYAICACSDIHEFVDRVSTDEWGQLELFILFLKKNSWDKYLRMLDWVEFARHYNGPSFAQNNYDVKLAQAYQRYK